MKAVSAEEKKALEEHAGGKQENRDERHGATAQASSPGLTSLKQLDRVWVIFRSIWGSARAAAAGDLGDDQLLGLLHHLLLAEGERLDAG